MIIDHLQSDIKFMLQSYVGLPNDSGTRQLIKLNLHNIFTEHGYFVHPTYFSITTYEVEDYRASALININNNYNRTNKKYI